MDDYASKQERAARLVGRLFGKNKDKNPTTEEDVNAFLHGPSDKLCLTGTTPKAGPYTNTNAQARPKLGKLDTSAARRWPSAQNVIASQALSKSVPQSKITARGRTSAPPPKRKKNLTVRFKEIAPEIIGEGGDEFEEPTIEISKRKRSQTHPQYALPGSREYGCKPELPARAQQRPVAAPRMATGPYTNPFDAYTPSPRSGGSGASTPRIETPQDEESAGHGSLVARMQRQMEISEGQALIADRRASAMPSHDLGQTGAGAPHLTDPRARTQNVGGLDPFADPRQQSRAKPGQSSLSSVARAGSTESRPKAQSVKSKEGSVSLSAPSAISPSTGAHHSTLPYDNEALDEFSIRIIHYYKLFKLSAESVMPIGSTPFESLLRAASWWFLRGRTAIERVVKRRATGNIEGLELLKAQGIADLAKCYWILDEILMERSEIDERSPDELYALEKTARANGHNDVAEILERHQALYASLRKLTASMMKNNVMPPEEDEAILVQGLNTAIWVPYPWQEPKMQKMLSGLDVESLLSPGGMGSMPLSDALPLGDTANTFVYNRTHVGVFLNMDRGEAQGYRLPCVLSIQRDRAENGLSALISSQDGIIALTIQAKPGYNKPTWKDVKWDVPRDFIDVKLGQGLGARIVFPPGELTSVYNLYEYTSKVMRNFRPMEDEDLVIETTTRSVQYMPQDKSNRDFPKEEILHCRIRVFEKVKAERTATGNHARHRGIRIALTTGPNTRTFHGLSYVLPTSRPIRFEHMRLDYGSSLFLYLEEKCPVTLALTFETNQDRWIFHNCLIGGQRPNESTQAVINLLRYSITGASDADVSSTRTVLDTFQWKSMQVIRHNFGADATPRQVQTAPHMRLIAESHNNDRITDRLLTAPGELRIRVSTHGTLPEISILRASQQDLTVSCPESKMPSDTRHGLNQLLGLMSKLPTIRTYQFQTSEDLHEFQHALTGYRVIFDGTASQFAINRRRSMVPIHKKWEAHQSRIQVMENGTSHQIAVFFKNFAHGECMNFRIKATDNFESFGNNGKYKIRLANAKFALPDTPDKEMKDGEERVPRQEAFVQIDLLDWVSENDDIIIDFEAEAGKSKYILRIRCSLLIA